MTGDGIMNKQFDPFGPIKWYYDNVASQHPLLDAALVSSALAGVGYFVAPKLVKGVYRMTGGSPEEAAAASKDLERDPDAMAAFRKRAALVGGLAGVAYGLGRVWLGGKGRQESTLADAQKVASSWDNQDDDFDENILSTSHSFYDPFPKHKALNALQRDPVLFTSSKKQLYELVDMSSSKPTTNGVSLTSAAINAGIGYGAAWLFGQGIGKLMALPQPMTDRLSMAGGVAAAVLDSGILREL